MPGGGGAPFPLHQYCYSVNGDVSDKFLQYLEDEKKFMETNGFSESLHPQSWRISAVKFIDKMVHQYMSEYDNKKFDAMIPYVAMTYYDRFTSKQMIPNVSPNADLNKDLFALCCLSTAWKYHLIENVPFKLRNFETSKTGRYSKKEAAKMEMFISRQLEWKFETVTPFLLAEYLIPSLNLPRSWPSPRRSIRHLIVKSQADVELTKHAPSVVAASAVLAVYLEMFPTEYNKMEAEIFSTFPPLSKEGVKQCREKFSRLYKIKPQLTFNEACDPIAFRPHISFGRVIENPKITDHLFLTSIPPTTKSQSEEDNTEETNVGGESSTSSIVAKDEYLMNFKLGWSEVIAALDS